MKLIDATPTSVHPSGTLGFCFTFGDPIVGQHVGVVYLGKEPCYTRFLVTVDKATDLPSYQPVSERPLTPEEVAHFGALVPAPP